MEAFTAFDQYNHYPSEQPLQEAAPPRRSRYARRSSVTQYNLANYQPQHQQTYEEEPVMPRQRVARRCSVTQYNLYTVPLSGGEPAPAPSPEPPQRQRYRRRSSVTQYNLETYQQQQQTYQPQAPAQEQEADQPEVPRQRYRRRSSVTQYNLESYLQQQKHQQPAYHPQPHTAATVEDVGTPTQEAEPPRQRYRRRSSVTQYNLESYQQQQLQQQQDEIMLRAQEVVVQPPLARYPRRSSVTQYNLGTGILSTPPLEVSCPVKTEAEDDQAPPTSLNASVYPNYGDDDDDDFNDDSASQHSGDGLSLASSAHGTRTLLKEASFRDACGVQARRCSINSFVSSGEDLLTCSSAASLTGFEVNNSSYPARRSSIQFGTSSSRRGSITSAPATTSEYRRAASFRISKPERRLSLQPTDVVSSFMNSGDIVADFNLDGTETAAASFAHSKTSMSFTAVSGHLSFDCSFSSLAGGGASGIGSVVGVQ